MKAFSHVVRRRGSFVTSSSASTDILQTACYSRLPDWYATSVELEGAQRWYAPDLEEPIHRLTWKGMRSPVSSGWRGKSPVRQSSRWVRNSGCPSGASLSCRKHLDCCPQNPALTLTLLGMLACWQQLSTDMLTRHTRHLCPHPLEVLAIKGHYFGTRAPQCNVHVVLIRQEVTAHSLRGQVQVLLPGLQLPQEVTKAHGLLLAMPKGSAAAAPELHIHLGMALPCM